MIGLFEAPSIHRVWFRVVYQITLEEQRKKGRKKRKTIQLEKATFFEENVIMLAAENQFEHLKPSEHWKKLY